MKKFLKITGITLFALLTIAFATPYLFKGKIVALDIKAGDRILFGKWTGTEVKVDGEELLIMKESDVMGVVEA